MQRHAWNRLRSLSGTASLMLLVAASGCAAQSTHSAGQIHHLMHTSRVVYTHPDLWKRYKGIRSYRHGDKQHALTMFRQAAYYGDKPSEAMIATMYWNGDGVPANRPLAYAWMDLAADRGYPRLLAQRELYWSKLDARQRKTALAVGKNVYAEYADAKADKRLRHALTALRKEATGSRLGFDSNMDVFLIDHSVLSANSNTAHRDHNMHLKGTRLDSSTYYAPSLTSLHAYLRLKDEAWTGRKEHGQVTVGRLQDQRGKQRDDASSGG